METSRYLSRDFLRTCTIVVTDQYTFAQARLLNFILQMLRRSNMKWNEYTLKPILEEEFHGNSCALIPWSITIGHVIVRATLADFPSVILSYL